MPQQPERHSRWGGSKAHVWSECPGSVAMRELAPPQQENDAMRRGTKIHKMAAFALSGIDYTPFEAVTADELEIVNAYVAACMKIRGSTFSGVEHAVWMDENPEVFGTIDFITEDPEWLSVVDLKSGTYEVNPIHNKQLLFYTWLRIRKDPTPTPKIRLGIYQGGSLNWWETTADEVMEYGVKFEAAIKSRQLIAGQHCSDCDAIGICVEARKMVPLVRHAMPVCTASPEVIAQSLPLLPLVKAMSVAIEETAMDLAMAGKLPGYHVVDGRKKPLAWKVDDIDPTALGLREEDVYTSTLKTATQIAKLSSEDKLVALGYAERGKPNPKLEPITQSAAVVSLTNW